MQIFLYLCVQFFNRYMQENTETASEILAKIERNVFKGAGLKKACKLDGEERRDYVFSQVERLLTEAYGSPHLALYLSDQFWTADKGRTPMYENDPLTSLEGQQTLTDEEMSRLRLIMEIAGLCHDLALHYEFDIVKVLGVKDGFWVSNKALVEWLTTTKYEWMAMHTAYILLKKAIGVYASGHYQPAQDTLAELYSPEYNELVREPGYTDLPPRVYIKTIVDKLQRIDRHWKRGRKLNMRPDLIILHDEIYGRVPGRFNKDVLAAAQELYDYMDKELYGRLRLKDFNEDGLWSELPESVKRTWNEVLERFADKVREVRTKYLSEGWVPDSSLEFIYLLAHAENCGYGVWREEDRDL